MNRQDVNREVQQIFGFVPGFLNAVPDEHIGPLWESMRILQFEDGEIPAKYQQLIMLGVATYAKCRYCIDFHTEVAKTMGATPKEITETALLVGNTALWSNIVTGIQYDLDTFKREVRKACANVAQNASGKAPPQRPPAARA